jgi:hypothetical protein
MAERRTGADRRKRGRPPVSSSESSTDVHLTIPDSLYDLVYAAASLKRITVPEAIRQAVQRDLETQNSQTVTT